MLNFIFYVTKKNEILVLERVISMVTKLFMIPVYVLFLKFQSSAMPSRFLFITDCYGNDIQIIIAKRF